MESKEEEVRVCLRMCLSFSVSVGLETTLLSVCSGGKLLLLLMKMLMMKEILRLIWNFEGQTPQTQLRP